MNNKKNNNLIDKILIVIIILLLILTIVNLIIFNKKPEENSFIQSHRNQKNIEQIDEYLVKPTYYGYVFADYKGEYSQNDIIKATNNLSTQVILKLCEEVKMNDFASVEKYFNENKFVESGKITNIENTNVGIENMNAFKKLINSLKDIKIAKYSFDYSLKFDKNSIQQVEDGIKATLLIHYEQNKDFGVDLLIKNKDENNVMLLICE